MEDAPLRGVAGLLRTGDEAAVAEEAEAQPGPPD